MVELASQIACGECGAFPEGVLLEDGRERLHLSCPEGRCATNSVVATEFRIKLEFIERGLALFAGRSDGPRDMNGLLRLALAVSPARHEPDDPNKRYVAVHCRLTPVQSYLYGFRSLPERSALANAALCALIEREARNV
jgi:hypothetical protein